MNALTVLIDTNVLIDFMTARPPFTETAKEIVRLAHEKKINAFLAAHSVTNIFYVLRKHYSVSDMKQRLTDLCKSIPPVELNAPMILNALGNKDFDDIEDCLQSECAAAVNADYVITRDIDDFAKSKILPITPTDFLKRF